MGEYKIEQFSTDELIEELKTRKLDDSNKEALFELSEYEEYDSERALGEAMTFELIDELNNRGENFGLLDDDGYAIGQVESLDDKNRMEHLLKVFGKYSTSQIEAALPV